MGLQGNEELDPVGVGPAVGHGHHPPLVVLQYVHDLIGEFPVGRRVDALAALPRACHNHKRLLSRGARESKAEDKRPSRTELLEQEWHDM
jgi:hypothetical protein